MSRNVIAVLNFEMSEIFVLFLKLYASIVTELLVLLLGTFHLIANELPSFMFSTYVSYCY